MMTEVIDCEAGALRIGMPLQATFRESAEGVWVAVFRGL